MIILSISPVVIDSQTPSIPSRFGNISTGRTIKIMVLQKDRISHLKLTLCSNFTCVSKSPLLFYLSQQQICELILCHDRRFHFVIV